MSRYREALCRLCRREGMKLNLKGSKCDTAKCILERRDFPPGQHGKGRHAKLSEYGIQLREKQKLRRIYGIMERQFSVYFKRASKKKGITGDALLQSLETRLDNIVYRLGFSTGRRGARQLVQHGHIRVNNRKVNIPSYPVKCNDVINAKENDGTKNLITKNMELSAGRPVPLWIQLEKERLQAKILHLPERHEINVPIDEHLIVELYSK